MNFSVAIISVTTLVLLLAFAARQRNWIRSMRRDIHDIREEVCAIKRSNKSMGAAISGMSAESVGLRGRVWADITEFNRVATWYKTYERNLSNPTNKATPMGLRDYCLGRFGDRPSKVRGLTTRQHPTPIEYN